MVIYYITLCIEVGMNMERYEIKRKIQYYEEEINRLQRNITKLALRIEKLTASKNYCQKANDRFIEFTERKRRQYYNVGNLMNIKFADISSEMMLDTLHVNKINYAEENMNDTIMQIEREIMRVEDQIQEQNRNIVSYEGMIENLYYQMRLKD